MRPLKTSMIDWYPLPALSPSDLFEEDPDRALARWRSLVGLRRLAAAVDAKEAGTAGHSERVAALADLLAAEAGWCPKRRTRLRVAALVHDVGKASVPDDVLLSRDPLCGLQIDAIRLHAAAGAELAAHVLDLEQRSWVRHHHERWDGAGYPDGLSGDEIPGGAAIIAIADAYDAMTQRPRSGQLGGGEALEECMRGYRRQFAPWAVDLLIDVAPLLSHPKPPPAPLQLVA